MQSPLKSRLVLILAVLSAAGCGRPPQPARLRFDSFDLGEELVPLPFSIRVANGGDEPGRVDAVEAHVLSTIPIVAPGLTAPNDATMPSRVLLFGKELIGGISQPLADGKSIPLVGRQTTDVWCAFDWLLPRRPAPMVMVVSASFALKYDKKSVVETEPVTFVLQSRPGILPAIIQTKFADEAQATAMIRTLDALPGTKSAGVESLVRWLRAGPAADNPVGDRLSASSGDL